MCGKITLDGKVFEIYCEMRDPRDIRPDPVIDFTRLVIDGDPSPVTDPWRGELTAIGGMLASAGHFSDPQIADRLGTAIAEVGNSIGEQAPINITFGWAQHS